MAIDKKAPSMKANKLKALKEPITLTAKPIKEIKTPKKKVIKSEPEKSLPVTQEQIKTLFEQSPALFDFINERPIHLKYGYDIFERYPTVQKGKLLDLKESVISDADGKMFNLMIDNDTRRIATQQRRKLGITLPELFRNAIWTYIEILTSDSTFNKSTGHIEK